MGTTRNCTYRCFVCLVDHTLAGWVQARRTSFSDYLSEAGDVEVRSGRELRFDETPPQAATGYDVGLRVPIQKFEVVNLVEAGENTRRRCIEGIDDRVSHNL